MGVTGLKTAELKSGGFGSCYGGTQGHGGGEWLGFSPKASSLLALFLPSLSCIRDVDRKKDSIWVENKSHLSQASKTMLADRLF